MEFSALDELLEVRDKLLKNAPEKAKGRIVKLEDQTVRSVPKFDFKESFFSKSASG